MATRIIEYGGNGRSDLFPTIPISLVQQTALTATGTSAQSAAVSTGTTIVLVQSDEAVYVARGSNPTATTDHYRLQAGGEQFFDITPGWKVAIRT